MLCLLTHNCRSFFLCAFVRLLFLAIRYTNHSNSFGNTSNLWLFKIWLLLVQWLRFKIIVSSEKCWFLGKTTVDFHALYVFYQYVKCRMICGFPLTSSLLFHFQVKHYTHIYIYYYLYQFKLLDLCFKSFCLVWTHRRIVTIDACAAVYAFNKFAVLFLGWWYVLWITRWNNSRCTKI